MAVRAPGPDHLVDLFHIFGFVTHVYIPVDENGSSRGVAYVKFAHRREAESAIERVNGFQFVDLRGRYSIFGYSVPSWPVQPGRSSSLQQLTSKPQNKLPTAPAAASAANDVSPVSVFQWSRL
ncbi:uncharacterized protein [Miscanthus floridulus]|uniref:uncharacterized protein n=1 Tax=Miscanthus floridulus TaxID=154761 RepID=UPI00345A348E